MMCFLVGFTPLMSFWVQTNTKGGVTGTNWSMLNGTFQINVVDSTFYMTLVLSVVAATIPKLCFTASKISRHGSDRGWQLALAKKHIARKQQEQHQALRAVQQHPSSAHIGNALLKAEQSRRTTRHSEKSEAQEEAIPCGHVDFRTAWCRHNGGINQDDRTNKTIWEVYKAQANAQARRSRNSASPSRITE
mmetsp:Transcript_45936/g.97975  ORF Transcript_45936/g.97975 Transcript_45936/m.97975 type:complete len:191 (-) Transcript_45936:305-877(-)